MTTQELSAVIALLTPELARDGQLNRIAAIEPLIVAHVTAMGRQWLPIESAPKDKTIVDLWTEHSERLTDYFRVELSADNVFYDPVESGVCCVRNATHWMKLPNPPTK